MTFRLYVKQISSLLAGFIQPLLSCTPRSSALVDGLSEGLVIGGHSVDLQVMSGQGQGMLFTVSATTADRSYVGTGNVPIDMVPDDVLVEVFYFFTKPWIKRKTEWYTLVHVCQRWRYIVFASPSRLGAQLVYTGKRPTSEMLDGLPVLPVVITDRPSSSLTLPLPLLPDSGWRNIAAALDSEHNRTCEIDLAGIPYLHWERISTVMQRPFPELTHLRISLEDDWVAIIPDSFLGGSAPRLQMFTLRNASFPAMYKLLSSANDLVTLRLCDIPDSGYISPEAVATCLLALPRLKSLCLQFKSPPFRSDSDPTTRCLSPLSCPVQHSLTELVFKGDHEYLEDLVSQIGAPLLHILHISFFMDFHFHVPRLHRFINHTEIFKPFNPAMVFTFDRSIKFELCPTWVFDHQWKFVLEIGCWDSSPPLQLSSLAQVCSSSLTLIPRVERLSIRGSPYLQSLSEDNVAQWLELLNLFTAVKDLHLSFKVELHVCHALGELATERVTEVLPALKYIYLEGYRPSGTVQHVIQRFVAARELSGCPVVVRSWMNGWSSVPNLNPTLND